VNPYGRWAGCKRIGDWINRHPRRWADEAGREFGEAAILRLTIGAEIFVGAVVPAVILVQDHIGINVKAACVHDPDHPAQALMIAEARGNIEELVLRADIVVVEKTIAIGVWSGTLDTPCVRLCPLLKSGSRHEAKATS
jgi:hypothetical protein